MQFTRKERDVLEAIFSLARLTTDLYASEKTIAREARCSRRLVTYCMRWFESSGIVVRTRTGGRVPGVWIEKETNRYQIRYDNLRKLLSIKEVKKVSLKEMLEQYNREKISGSQSSDA